MLFSVIGFILTKGEVLPVPVLRRVHFGARIALQDNETKASFLTRARGSVVALVIGFILPKGEVLPVPVLRRVHFGARIALQDDETKASFLTRARDSVVALRNI